MKKLCVVFPGRRYGCDRSMLYFPTEIIKKEGFETKFFHYDVPRETTDMIPVDENIKEAIQICEKDLSGMDLTQYDKIIFLSKSIGTTVSGAIESRLGLKNVSKIMITPLPSAVEYVHENDFIIAGTKDSYFPNEEAVLKERLGKPNSRKQTLFIDDIGHSMESGEYFEDSISYLRDVCEAIYSYLNLKA